MWFQTEATALKSLVSGGADTKIVALGIGGGVDESELEAMASLPTDVFRVQDFGSLPFVEERLRNESCKGNFETLTKSYIALELVR